MEKEIKPLSKKEVIELKKSNIPQIVIDAVNKLLIKKYDFYVQSATITVEEILDLIVGDKDCGKFAREEVFKNKMLDFEFLFEKEGWKVEFVSPSYCETFKPYFKFK